MTEQQMPQITGEQIRALRRNLGMTHLRFAQGLNVPVWLVEILEQESADAPHELEQPVQLAQLVPESVRNDFYQRLLKVYGLPETWESARVKASSPDEGSSTGELAGDLDETTLFIPVTVSVQMTMEWLDVLLRKYEALVLCKAGGNKDKSCDDKVTSYLITSLIQLSQLYCRANCKRGDAHSAKMNKALLKSRIFQRIRMLEDER